MSNSHCSADCSFFFGSFEQSKESNSSLLSIPTTWADGVGKLDGLYDCRPMLDSTFEEVPLLYSPVKITRWLVLQ